MVVIAQGQCGQPTLMTFLWTQVPQQLQSPAPTTPPSLLLCPQKSPPRWHGAPPLQPPRTPKQGGQISPTSPPSGRTSAAETERVQTCALTLRDVFFSPRDPLRCNSPDAMETNIEAVDPLGVNAPMHPDGVYARCHTFGFISCELGCLCQN